MLVLDSGGISRLAERTQLAAALILTLRRANLWPPLVPTAVLVESVSGHSGRDARVNRFLKTCEIDELLSEAMARRAAWLRTRARRGSAVDAVVVAAAEPGGVVMTQDPSDLRALASHARGVTIRNL